MKNKIVDSHCHLDFDDYSNDLDTVIRNAKLNDVEYLLSISVNLEKFKTIHNITKKYKNIWCTTGIHPNNVQKNISDDQFESTNLLSLSIYIKISSKHLLISKF